MLRLIFGEEEGDFSADYEEVCECEEEDLFEDEDFFEKNKIYF